MGKQPLASPLRIERTGDLVIADEAAASRSWFSGAASVAPEQAADRVDLPLLAFAQTPRSSRRDRLSCERPFANASAAQFPKPALRLPDRGLIAQDRSLNPFRHARRRLPARIDLLNAPDRGLCLAFARR